MCAESLRHKDIMVFWRIIFFFPEASYMCFGQGPDIGCESGKVKDSKAD